MTIGDVQFTVNAMVELNGPGVPGLPVEDGSLGLGDTLPADCAALEDPLVGTALGLGAALPTKLLASALLVDCGGEVSWLPMVEEASAVLELETGAGSGTPRPLLDALVEPPSPAESLIAERCGPTETRQLLRL